jgi:hypothetical protein
MLIMLMPVLTNLRPKKLRAASPEGGSTQNNPKSPNGENAFSIFKRREVVQYLIVGSILTGVVFVFSIFMIALASSRNSVSTDNYEATTSIYSGELRQSSPKLEMAPVDSQLNMQDNRRVYSSEELVRLVNNTKIVSTNAKVFIQADFVKKGLEYQPSFNTSFEADYELKNESEEESLLVFQFPFPYQLSRGEVSDVVLKVDGQEQENTKSKITYGNRSTQDGLHWEGKIPGGESRQISVAYRTVGLSQFNYEGLENETSAQDFNMNLTIEGTRSYDVRSGLTVTERQFGDNSVTLVWEKPNLFATPNVDVTVGDKTAPSNKVSRVYVAMIFIFVAFISILIWFGFKSNKLLKIRDLITISFLFLIYFPLLHYLTSFTIDPTMEVYAGLSDVGNFSMPLYGAFAISLTLIGGLMFYLHSRIYGLGFSLRSALPTILIMLGFFPLVITIPEYSILLVLLGIIILVFIWIQTRVKEREQ